MNTQNKSKTSNLKADIVIIGGGGSGITAAVRASENGAKNVVVIEKAGRPGGNAWLARGIFAVNSPAQKRLGMQSSRDAVFKEAMEASKWSLDSKIVAGYIDTTAELVQWLEDKGMRFDFVHGTIHEYATRQNGHVGIDHSSGPGWAGSTIVETELKDCEKLGIQILCKTTAKRILANSKGQIDGVLAATPDGEITINTGCVIISAGGFAANHELLKKYFPTQFQNPESVFRNSLGNMTGDGIIMAGEAGAATGEGLSIAIFGPHHHPWAYSVHQFVRRPEMIWINKNGERFIDESYVVRDGLGAAHSMSRQPGGVCYGLMDERVKEYIRAVPTERDRSTGEDRCIDTVDADLEKEAAEGKKVNISGSLDEIAAFIGAEPAILKATVERYNRYCAEGYDGDFIKGKEYLLPLDTPPYYAILGRRGFDTTYGGIKINHRMEVINKQGKVIPGLYATGDNASGWVGQNYAPSGASLTFAFCSGFIAGKNAAEYIQERFLKEG